MMLVSRHGTPTHRLLVPFADGHGSVFQAGEAIAYSGCGDRRFEPLKPADLYTWRASHSDPAWVAETNARGEVTGPENHQ
jgi:hypothetical protein